MSINKAPQKVPKLRFKGFTDDWEQRKLGEIADVKDSARISNEVWVENGIPYLRSSDLVNGELNGELFISNDTYEKYASKTGAPQKDDVLFTSGGKVGIVYHKMDASPVYVQGGAVLYVKTSTSVLLEGSFLSVYFSSPKMQLYLDIASSGGTIKHFTLKPANSSPIVFPSISEQSKIGQFFKTLDDTITLHQHKLDQLNQLKEALLQQMFPGKGETVPKLRFAGFEGDWEELKLSAVVDKQIKGKAQADKLNPGNVEYLDTARLNGGEPLLTDGISNVMKDDILILWDGSKAGTVYIGFEGALGSTLKAYRTNSDSQFVFQYLKRYQEHIYNNYRTPNIPHVQKDFLEVFTIKVPTMKEQTKIGNTLKHLDATITLQQRKLDQLQNMKQVLLQNMFI